MSRRTIMRVGDSLTAGYNDDVPTLWEGYGKPLNQLTDRFGWPVDFVGTQTFGTPDPTWDQDCEAYPGYIIGTVAAAASAAIATEQPHIILLHAGTNDCGDNTLAALAPANMAAALTLIHSLSPSTIILVSYVAPSSIAPRSVNIPIFNAALPAVIGMARAAGIPVRLVHVFDLLTVAELSDGVHPDAVGYAMAASAWFQELQPYIGLPILPRTAAYTLTNVWSTGTDADTSAYDECSYLTRPGLNIDGIGRAAHRAFAPPGTPALDFVLPNYDGRYSPGGTLGSFVGRGPTSTVTADWGNDVLVDDPAYTVDDSLVLVDGRLDVALFTGTIDTAPQDIDRISAQVQVRSLGRIALLDDSSPLIALSENIRTDQAVTLILDAVGWPADDRVIDTGDQTLLYFWADGRTSASALINAIQAAEGVPGCAYEDGAGRFHFEGRQFRDNNYRSTTVQWNLYDGASGTRNATVDDPGVLVDDPNVLVDGPVSALLYHVRPSQWASNPDEVVSTVSATVNVRTAQALGKVWEYGTPLVLSSLETRDIEIELSDPCKSAVTPVNGVDYTVSVGSVVAHALLETSGTKIRWRIQAASGGATVIGVTSNGPQLRAVSLPVTSTVPVTTTVETPSASARFRPKPYTIPLWAEITANDARDRCDTFARRYQTPRDQMTIQMANIDGITAYAILTMAPSDRLHILHSHGGISADFFVEQMHHDLGTGGGLHKLILACERITEDAPARFDVDRFDMAVFAA